MVNACIYQYKNIKLNITRLLLTAKLPLPVPKNLLAQFRGSHASMLMPDVVDVAT